MDDWEKIDDHLNISQTSVILFRRALSRPERMNVIGSELLKDVRITYSCTRPMKSKYCNLLTNLIRMSAKIVKQCVISSLLPYVFNCSLRTGVYSEFMSGNIALLTIAQSLPCLSKIFKTAIINRLVSFLDAHKYFYLHQHGFKSKTGTDTTVFELID